MKREYATAVTSKLTWVKLLPGARSGPPGDGGAADDRSGGPAEWAGTKETITPAPGTPLTTLGFLTIGLFGGADPRPGHESTLDIITLGEDLGFNSAWVRNRHLQYGISSPIVVLSAASQRTSRIGLGTAVIPLGWENPLRLAEDLATVDLLSGGRLIRASASGHRCGGTRSNRCCIRRHI